MTRIDVVPLLPALVPLAGVVLVLVADLVVPTLRRVPLVVALVAAAGVVGTSVPGVVQGAGETLRTFCAATPAAGGDLPTDVVTSSTCSWQADALTSTLQLAAGLAALVCVALAWPRTGRRRPREATREPVEAVLLLTALAGTVAVAAARDLGTWLVALELATLPVVVLVALSGRRGAVAGATQLLVTSLVSFALLVLGAGLWLVATGSPWLTPDAALLSTGVGTPAAAGVVGYASLSKGVMALAVVLVVAGLGFKLSLAPFHAWTPTAYSGAATPVATFLATVSKVAAVAGLLVVLRATAVLGTPGVVAVGVLAALSMTLGNVMALRQDDVVRLLAWSTVAQAGWVVMPLVSVSPLGTRAAATYLLTYVAATLVAFAVVALSVREAGEAGRGLDAFTGLWRRSPWRAGALALALTSLAGLPPGVVGLVGKVVALRPVVVEGWIWLAAVAAVNAVLGVAVYLRWLRPVVTDVAPVDGATPAAVATRPGPGHRRAIAAGLALAAAVLLAASVQPDLVLRFLG